MKKHALIIVIPLIILSAASCKKHNGPAPGNPATDNALISNVRYISNSGFLTTYHITYNTNNTVDSIIETEYSSTLLLTTVTANKFCYFNGYYTIVITYQYGNYISDTVYTVYLNGDGSIKSIGNPALFKFNYANNHVSSFQEIDPGWHDPLGHYIPADTTNYFYSWDNHGNIDSVTTSPFKISNQYYTYDLTKFGQKGDLLRIGQFLQFGKTYTNSINVPISQYYTNSAPPVPNLFYDYDSLGRIIKAYTLPVVTGGYGYDSVIYYYSYY